jgi:hypothetical protein
LDYVNLCAEEYNLYRKRFVMNDVWLTWVDGMVEKFAQCHKLYAVALNQALGFDPNNEVDTRIRLYAYNSITSSSYYKLFQLMSILQPKINQRVLKEFQN